MAFPKVPVAVAPVSEMVLAVLALLKLIVPAVSVPLPTVTVPA